MIGVPKTQVNLLFDYVVPNTDKLAFSTNFHYESGTYIDDANTQKTPSFFYDRHRFEIRQQGAFRKANDAKI